MAGLPGAREPLWQVMQLPGRTPWCLKGPVARSVLDAEPGIAAPTPGTPDMLVAGPTPCIIAGTSGAKPRAPIGAIPGTGSMGAPAPIPFGAGPAPRMFCVPTAGVLICGADTAGAFVAVPAAAPAVIDPVGPAGRATVPVSNSLWPILAFTLVTVDAPVPVIGAGGVMVIALLATAPPLAVPVPLSCNVCVPGLPESTIVSVALYAPTLLGVKYTSIAQLVPGTRDAGNAPQVFVCAKLAAFLPPIVIR